MKFSSARLVSCTWCLSAARLSGALSQGTCGTRTLRYAGWWTRGRSPVPEPVSQRLVVDVQVPEVPHDRGLSFHAERRGFRGRGRLGDEGWMGRSSKGALPMRSHFRFRQDHGLEGVGFGTGAYPSECLVHLCANMGLHRSNLGDLILGRERHSDLSQRTQRHPVPQCDGVQFRERPGDVSRRAQGLGDTTINGRDRPLRRGNA